MVGGGSAGFRLDLPHDNVTLELLAEKMQLIADRLNKYDTLTENTDFFFLTTCGVIISLMQIGFGLLESGCVDTKNSLNVWFKNMMDMLLCGLVFWLWGNTLAFGEGNSFSGLYYYQGGKDLGTRLQYSHLFFQLSYASTPSTITSGAVVGRITFISYIVYSSFFTGVVYPIVCHWAWTPQGWLVQMGFKDFCGSGVVHLTGGACAIAAAVVLGARTNRFPKPGTELSEQEKQRFQPHNIPMAALGIMILFTGFFSFNGGSVLHISQKGDGEMVGKIMINTWLCASASAFGTLVIFRTGLVDHNPRWSMLHPMNALLSGMAATCAHADALDLWAAFVVGLLNSIVYTFIFKAEEWLKVDDPLSVVPVHFGGGIWGLTFASLFRSDSLVGGYPEYAGQLLGVQIAGGLAIIAWSMGLSFLLFSGLRILGVLRVTPEHELEGADATKHKEQAYRGFPCNCEHKKTDGDSHLSNDRALEMEMLGVQLKRQAIGNAGAGAGVVNPALDITAEMHHRYSSVDL